MKMRDQKGQTLIEVIMAMAILGIVVSGLLTAMHITYKTTDDVNDRTIAESLARGQLEYIKTCAYDDVHNPPEYGLDPDIDLSATPYNNNFQVDVTAVRLDPSQNGTEDDEGIQEVTVTVRAHGEAIFTVVEYKVNR